MGVIFIGERNKRKPPICHKSLTNFGIGHKLWQQLFKARSLQITTNYIHDSNHTMTYLNLHKDVEKQCTEKWKKILRTLSSPLQSHFAMSISNKCNELLCMLRFQVIIVQMVRKSLTSIPVLLVPLTTVQDYVGTQNVQLVKVCYISFIVEIGFSYIVPVEM